MWSGLNLARSDSSNSGWFLVVPLGPICLLVQRYIYQLSVLLSGADILKSWSLRDELFICQGLKVAAWQCELASDDIPRDVETCGFIYQTSWHVWVFMFDLVDLMYWVGGFSARNQVFLRWASGKTQQNSFHWLYNAERKKNPETRHLSCVFPCTQFYSLLCLSFSIHSWRSSFRRKWSRTSLTYRRTSSTTKPPPCWRSEQTSWRTQRSRLANSTWWKPR